MFLRAEPLPPPQPSPPSRAAAAAAAEIGPGCGATAGGWRAQRPLSELVQRPAPCPSHAAPEAEADAAMKNAPLPPPGVGAE